MHSPCDKQGMHLGVKKENVICMEGHRCMHLFLRAQLVEDCEEQDSEVLQSPPTIQAGLRDSSFVSVADLQWRKQH
jgi:hypothetical protein